MELAGGDSGDGGGGGGGGGETGVGYNGRSVVYGYIVAGTRVSVPWVDVGNGCIENVQWGSCLASRWLNREGQKRDGGLEDVHDGVQPYSLQSKRLTSPTSLANRLQSHIMRSQRSRKRRAIV